MPAKLVYQSEIQQTKLPDPDALEYDVMKILLEGYEAIIEALRPAMKDADLTEPQWRVLHELAGRSPVIASDLASKTFVRASSLSRILRDLEARDLVARAQQFEDLRKTLVSLTDRGRRQIKGVERRYREIVEQLRTAIPDDNLESAQRLSVTLAQQLGGLAGSDISPD